MRLNFRQGIVKHQTDQNGTSQFLRHDPSRKTVSIVIHDIPTLISFCHRDSNYLIEESISIDHPSFNQITGITIIYVIVFVCKSDKEIFEYFLVPLNL